MINAEKKRISRTLSAFCSYCEGFGLILIDVPLYKKIKSLAYVECSHCKGLGFNKDWYRVGCYKPKKNKICDFTAKQIRALSKKNLNNLYLKEKLSIRQIAKKIDIGYTLIRNRLHLYNIKMRSAVNCSLKSRAMNNI